MEDNVKIEERFCEYCKKEYTHPLESNGAGWHEPFFCEAQ
jgi:hypothetical protein